MHLFYNIKRGSNIACDLLWPSTISENRKNNKEKPYFTPTKAYKGTWDLSFIFFSTIKN